MNTAPTPRGLPVPPSGSEVTAIAPIPDLPIASSRGADPLLVAVGPNSLAEQLVRWTHRMATTTDTPWVAVHVETSRLLTKTAQEKLDNALTLARELGAEVIIVYDANVAAALVRVRVLVGLLLTPPRSPQTVFDQHYTTPLTPTSLPSTSVHPFWWAARQGLPA